MNNTIASYPAPVLPLTGAELLAMWQQGGQVSAQISALVSFFTAQNPGFIGPAGLLLGSGPPSNSTGVNGQGWLDTTNAVLYGPKANGAWPSGVSLLGPASTVPGPKGDTGNPTTYLQAVSANGRLLTFVDKLSRILAYIDSGNIFTTYASRVKSALYFGTGNRKLVGTADTRLGLEIADSAGKLQLRVRDGVTQAASLKTALINGRKATTIPAMLGTAALSNLDIQRLLVWSYGQSLSVGVGASAGPTTNSGPTVLTTDQPYGNLMLKSGVVWYDPAADTSALVNHVEAIHTGPGSGETLLGGAQAMLMQLLNAYGLPLAGHGVRTVALGAGQPATAIAGLRLGQSPFTRFQGGVSAVNSLCTGKVIKSLFGFWLQGESDSAAGYDTSLVGMAGEIDSMIRGITAQTETAMMFSYQLSRADICQKYIDASASRPDLIRIFAPLYPYEVNGQAGAQYDTTHRSAAGYRLLGATAMVAAFTHFFCKRPWRPLQISQDARGRYKMRTDGADLIVKYDVPHGGQLALDSPNIVYGADVLQRGFYLFNSTGTEKPIAGVQIEGRNEVRLVGCTAVVGDTLRVGFKDPTQTTLSMTQLRDCQGDILTLDDGSNAPIHNWALTQQHTIATGEI